MPPAKVLSCAVVGLQGRLVEVEWTSAWYAARMETVDQRELTRQALALYERFGRPLEAAHRGQYVAIALDGRYILAPSSTEALIQGAAQFGPGNFIFKVGDIAAEVWK